MDSAAQSPKAYISGALTGVIDLRAARARYERAASVCKAHGYVVYVPHLHNDPVRDATRSALEVYESDLQELVASELVVALLDPPSTGVGAELAIALSRKANVIAIARPGSSVSRFIEGMLTAARARLVVSSDEDLDPALTAGLIAIAPDGGLGRPGAGRTASDV